MSIKMSLCSKSENAFNTILAAIFFVGGLLGYYAVDAIGFWLSSDRRVTFTVVNGEVDESSIRINRFFSIPDGPLTEAQKQGQKWFPLATGSQYVDGEVFSFPTTLAGAKATTCVYKFGDGYVEKYKFPPNTATNPGPPPTNHRVPPCPEYDWID